MVILGGGFGGLAAARALRRAPVRVTLVDRQNHHLFQPLLYQVATAALNPSDIAAPIRHLLRDQENTTVLLAEATRVDVAARRVEFSDGAVTYDHLIIATGATHSYFGHDEWARHAPGLKTLEDAVEIRQRFLLAFEAAERESDPARRAALLTFVIIGAGPTGVEMAGAMAEIARDTLASEFHRIDTRRARVVLVEGVDRVLPAYAPELSASARAELEKRGHLYVQNGAKWFRSTGFGDEKDHAEGKYCPPGQGKAPLRPVWDFHGIVKPLAQRTAHHTFPRTDSDRAFGGIIDGERDEDGRQRVTSGEGCVA